MRKIFHLLFFCFFALLFFIVPVFGAPTFPKPVGFVNDFASLYSSRFRVELEENLTAFKNQTGVEIGVATIPRLSGEPIETYGVKLFEEWKIGRKDLDNGLLLLIAKEDRAVRIEVGYGVEQYVTDGRAGDIIRGKIVPAFKKNDFEGGTLAAISQLQEYIADKSIAPVAEKKSNNDDGAWVFFLIMMVYIGGTYLASYLGRTKEIWPGAVLGAIGGGIGGLFIATFLGFLFGAFLFGGFGLFLDYILSKNYEYRRKKGLPTGFMHTWGGLSSGGRSGGFGGFGGGSSGGGGASGRW